MVSMREREKKYRGGQDERNNGGLAYSDKKITDVLERDGDPDDDRPPMFRLLQFYAIASAAAFLVISMLLVVVDRLHEFDKLIDAVERQNVGVARSFANVIWPRFSDYAMTVGDSRGDVLRARRETEDLQDAVLQLTDGMPILRIKVYDRTGRTIFSSEPNQIGTLYTSHLSFLAAASEGFPRSQYMHSRKFMSVVGPLQQRDIVESYLPIWVRNEKIEGILEIYTDITQDLSLLDRRTVETAVAVATVFTTLYVILFLIVMRANTVVGRQYACLLQSRENLDQRNATLIQEIGIRETLARNLQASELRFRSLSDRLIYLQEEERKRVARELHDGIGQGLTDIKGRVERAMNCLLTRNPKGVRDCLDSAVSAVRSNIEEVRRISMGLRPSILDDLGIVSTLSWACRTFRENHPEIEIVQNLSVVEQELSESVKTVIYRTLQEGLNNIVRHSGASRVRISLDKRGNCVRFTISDNGRGIPRYRAEAPNQIRPTLGIYSLRERAYHSGGMFRLKSIIGMGTTIRVTWPLQEYPCEPTDPIIRG